MSGSDRKTRRGGPNGPPLFIGVGNDFRCDDGVGLLMVRELAQRLQTDARFVEASGEGARLMDTWSGAGDVILFDAVSANEPPGTVLQIDALAQQLPPDWFHLSSHAFGVAEAVEMARALKRLPGSLTIYGIQGASFEAGQGLTPAVRKAAKDLVRRIADEVRSTQR